MQAQQAPEVMAQAARERDFEDAFEEQEAPEEQEQEAPDEPAERAARKKAKLVWKSLECPSSKEGFLEYLKDQGVNGTGYGQGKVWTYHRCEHRKIFTCRFTIRSLLEDGNAQVNSLRALSNLQEETTAVLASTSRRRHSDASNAT